MPGFARARLAEERKAWRKDHPFGFYARPRKDKAGALDLLIWEVGIPGKADTDWNGGLYKIVMFFPEEYPTKPLEVQFHPPLFHPNVYPSGTICLSILDEEKDWKPSISLKQIAIGVQDLLTHPNTLDSASEEAYELFVSDRKAYDKKIRTQARERQQQ